MTLKERLQDDLKNAIRSQDDASKRTLRLALAAVKNKEIEEGRDLTDTEVVVILQKEVKARHETLQELSQVERPEMAAAQQAELEVLNGYLPKQLDRNEIEQLARKVIAETGAKGPGQMGMVMGKLMPEVQGQADGKVVSQVVRELLSG
jgi:uncharacterized protein YqeY